MRSNLFFGLSPRFKRLASLVQGQQIGTREYETQCLFFQSLFENLVFLLSVVF